MQKVADIFAAWPSDVHLGRDIGMPYSTVSAWKQRGSIPAAYWKDIILAAHMRGHTEITADLLVDLHARNPIIKQAGFGEGEMEFNRSVPASPASVEDGRTKGHFSRFKHLRRSNFASVEEINEHIRALRDEWDHR